MKEIKFNLSKFDHQAVEATLEYLCKLIEEGKNIQYEISLLESVLNQFTSDSNGQKETISRIKDEIEMLKLRYGLVTQRKMTLREIGERFDLSISRISKILEDWRYRLSNNRSFWAVTVELIRSDYS